MLELGICELKVTLNLDDEPSTYLTLMSIEEGEHEIYLSTPHEAIDVYQHTA